MNGQEKDFTRPVRSTSAEGTHNNYIQTGGANRKIIVDGADAVGSFVTRSTVPRNMEMSPHGLKIDEEREVVDSTDISAIGQREKEKLSRKYFHSVGPDHA